MDVYGYFITPERQFMWPIYKSVYAHSPSQSGFTDVSCSQTMPHSFCCRWLNKRPMQMKVTFISFQERNNRSVSATKLKLLTGNVSHRYLLHFLNAAFCSVFVWVLSLHPPAKVIWSGRVKCTLVLESQVDCWLWQEMKLADSLKAKRKHSTSVYDENTYFIRLNPPSHLSRTTTALSVINLYTA